MSSANRAVSRPQRRAGGTARHCRTRRNNQTLPFHCFSRIAVVSPRPVALPYFHHISRQTTCVADPLTRGRTGTRSERCLTWVSISHDRRVPAGRKGGPFPARRGRRGDGVRLFHLHDHAHGRRARARHHAPRDGARADAGTLDRAVLAGAKSQTPQRPAPPSRTISPRPTSRSISRPNRTAISRSTSTPPASRPAPRARWTHT